MNLKFCLPSTFFCPLSQTVAQILQTFLNFLFRIRWQFWNIAAGWCVHLGDSDELDHPTAAAKQGFVDGLKLI